MPKTVLITGASTGIGYATALRFQREGWNVVATMRNPETARVWDHRDDRFLCLRLDVTDTASIQAAVALAQETFGEIDVLVNNAGYGLMGPFEAASPEQVERQLATNVLGLMAVTRAVLPQFRLRRSGVIINIASVGGRMAFPLYSLYHASKWAVEGFSDSLQYELAAFGIRVKLVEPGPIKTDFYSRSAEWVSAPGLTAYDAVVATVRPNMDRSGATGGAPEQTADVIYRAATDGRDRLRYPGGGNASILLLLRKLLPDEAFQWIVRTAIMR
jgi:NAD(P)-dependent dehydrogenase (short-subunit alcohol dehydrogenase family)